MQLVGEREERIKKPGNETFDFFVPLHRAVVPGGYTSLNKEGKSFLSKIKFSLKIKKDKNQKLVRKYLQTAKIDYSPLPLPIPAYLAVLIRELRRWWQQKMCVFYT